MMKEMVLDILVMFLNLIYCFHKLFPVRNRISVVSRQSDTPSLDAKMLMAEVKKKRPEVETEMVYGIIKPGLSGKIKYAFHMLGPEMHALATSRVVVLEGYCITASVLHHRKDLKIVQMWHALGALKKFGYAVEEEDEGYSSAVIKGLRMHKNYDVILTSSPYCRKYFAQGFGYPEDMLTVLPLPRTDLLRSPEYMDAKRTEVLKKYPQLEGKKTILYAPTFRKGRDVRMQVRGLAELAEIEGYTLIGKLHPNERDKSGLDSIETCEGFSSLELLSVCDYVVSDYSAFIFEAAVADKPVYLYTYDIDEYLERRGFFIDYLSEMPVRPMRSAFEVIKAITDEAYDSTRLRAFANKFVESGTNNTAKLANLVLGCYDVSSRSGGE
jgi:CDP-ribitol ribitolphosphotransferase